MPGRRHRSVVPVLLPAFARPFTGLRGKAGANAVMTGGKARAQTVPRILRVRQIRAASVRSDELSSFMHSDRTLV